MLLNLLIFVLSFAFMECTAWFTHKYIMHGWLWSLHKSHHQPKKGFEKNDFFGIFFAAIAIIFIWLGVDTYNYYFWIGLGITAYGAAYFIFHDVIVHQRLITRFKTTSPYLQKIIRAHKLHHKNLGKENGQYFGFLYIRKVK